MATTSGRGVITSRTRLSPNSTTCSISRASSCSMIPSSVAASTSASMACCSATGALGSSSEIRSTETARSSTARIGQKIQRHSRTSRNQRRYPVGRSFRRAAAAEAAAWRSRLRRPAAERFPARSASGRAQRYTMPSAVTVATTTSQNRASRLNAIAARGRSILKRGSISASNASRCRECGLPTHGPVRGTRGQNTTRRSGPPSAASTPK